VPLRREEVPRNDARIEDEKVKRPQRAFHWMRHGCVRRMPWRFYLAFKGMHTMNFAPPSGASS
jgi:hypothetical protein